jgi:hypothetical protein
MEVAWQNKLKEIRRVGKHDSFDDTEGMYDWRAEFEFLCVDCWEDGLTLEEWVQMTGYRRARMRPVMANPSFLLSI